MLIPILRILTYILGIAGTSLVLPLAVAVADSDHQMVPVFLRQFLVMSRPNQLI